MRFRCAACALLLTLGSLLAAEPRKLLVLAISGLDFRYLKDAEKLHLKIPVLRRLMAQGAVADGVVGVVPSGTWPAGTSLVTGVSPIRHGVLSDDRMDQTAQVPTLWQAAAQAHLKTATLFWPATLNATVDFGCPQFLDNPLSPDAPFDPISQKCTPGLVARIASVYPSFTKSLWNDNSAIDALNYLLEYEQPDLTLVQMVDLGVEERETGALSLYSREVLENEDDLLGQALRKLPAHTLVAVVSSQGFETEDYIVRPRVLLPSAAIEVRYGLIGALDQKSAAGLRKLIGIKKIGTAREVPMDEVRRFTLDLRTWVAAFGTMPGYIASASETGPAVGPGSRKGVMSLWPARADVRSSFVLWGEGIKPGHVGEISLLQIAPTLADILDVRLPDAKQPSLWTKIKK